ncbi:hypothetical protein BGZ52_009473 [Haplosporangium bisporale]|nr:hypothetical protein BGZ52_009473 [Haplosporangium bisporale]
MVGQGQSQKYLRWSRWLVVILALTAGMLYSISYYHDFFLSPLAKNLYVVAREVLPFIVSAVYGYALWGHKRLVPIYLRAFLVVGLAIGWLYVNILVLSHMQGGPFSCGGSKMCNLTVSSEFIATIAGFLMLAEVALTLKFGPYNPNASNQGESEQGKGAEAQHPAPILVSGQYQYLQQQPQFQQQYQYQPQFQQQSPPQFQQPQTQQQQFIPVTQIQPQQPFAYAQPQPSPPPALNYSTRPQQGAVLPTSP